MSERAFIKYPDGAVENSRLCHMFYIASLGFNIVPGRFWANGVSCDYESTPDGIKLTKKDGESMILPFRVAMAIVSEPITPTETSDHK